MCICSKLQELYYYFPKNFRRNLTYCKSKNFPDSSLHHIFEYENFRCPFILRKIAFPGEQNAKIKLQKIVGNLLERLRKLYMNGRVI